MTAPPLRQLFPSVDCPVSFPHKEAKAENENRAVFSALFPSCTISHDIYDKQCRVLYENAFLLAHEEKVFLRGVFCETFLLLIEIYLVDLVPDEIKARVVCRDT